jgi:hypothetical protein
MNLLLLFLFSCYGYVKSFDDFHKNTATQFPYARNLICELRIHDNWYYASVVDGYSFQRSQTVNVWPAYHRNVLACFQYEGYSYLIFYNKQTNGTEILRNQKTKNFQLPKGKFIFDNFDQTLYFLDQRSLYQINLEWLEKNFVSTNASTEILDKKIIDFQEDIIDIQIANSEIIYTNANNRLISRKLNGKYISVSSINGHKLPFIRLERIKRDSNYETLRLSVPPFTLAIPKSPMILEETNEKVFWLISLYIIDIVFFIILLYIIKCTRKFSKNSAYSLSNPVDETDITVLKPLIKS